MNEDNRYTYAKKVTLIGAFVNALLGIIKVIGGILFHSHALIADGLHSFSDLLTDSLVLFASKYSNQEADKSHPYGHQRIETAATLLLALLLILAGVGIAWDATYELLYETADMPGVLALPIAIISILANEGLYHYTHHIGTKINSTLITANAWHHRSDAASSIVVALGLLGSMAGFIHLDAIAAIIVALMIIKMGVTYGWDSVKELIDTAVDPQKVLQIESCIKNVDGVKKVHQLRSRSMGGDIFVDVHILVSPYLSVSEGHFIAQHVHHDLIAQLPDVKDVTVHVDPEDDEVVCPSFHLPNRSQIDALYLKPLQETFSCIQYWNLHYIDGQMIVELICTHPTSQITKLQKAVHALNKQIEFVQSIRILWQNDALKN